MTNSGQIIDGAKTQRALAVDTLALAFQDDPSLAWIFPEGDVRQRRLPLFFDWLFDDHLRHGMILTSEAREVVTLWRLPGKVHYRDPLTPFFFWRMLSIFGPAIYRAGKVDHHLLQHIPDGEGYLYLRYAAVRPDAQGKGWGGRAIRAGIEEANRRGLDTCLETSKSENLAIYQRLGFAIVDAWQVPNGPRFWTMVRKKD